MNQPSQTGAQSHADDEINLISIAIALGEQKRTLFGVPSVTVALALAYALLAPPVYTAQTVLLPPQQQQSAASSMLASLGSLASIAGAAGGVKSPEEMYVAFLQSQTIQDEVINRLNLRVHYRDKSMYDTRQDLARHVRISADKQSGLITIDADDRDPVFAAKLANTEVSALHDLLGRLAVTDAQQRRMFFGHEVKRTELALAAADATFRRLSAEGGLPVTQALAETTVQTSAALRAQITAKEVELAALRRFATSQNANVQRVSSQLGALRTQLTRLQQGGDRVVPASAQGEAAIAALRDLKTDQAVLEVMIKQYEMAKVDEAREGPLLQQVDVAQPPDHRSKPKRALIVALAAVGGLLIGAVAAIIRYSLAEARQDPAAAAQLGMLRRAWRSGSTQGSGS
jgi:uncharacterized protein involved in exopolysaccharide biosynthesis